MAYMKNLNEKKSDSFGTSQLLPVHTRLECCKTSNRLTRMPSVGNRTIGNIEVTAVIVINGYLLLIFIMMSWWGYFAFGHFASTMKIITKKKRQAHFKLSTDLIQMK